MNQRDLPSWELEKPTLYTTNPICWWHLKWFFTALCVGLFWAASYYTIQLLHSAQWQSLWCKCLDEDSLWIAIGVWWGFLGSLGPPFGRHSGDGSWKVQPRRNEGSPLLSLECEWLCLPPFLSMFQPQLLNTKTFSSWLGMLPVNHTRWQLAQRLTCDAAAAFDGLCPYGATKPGPVQSRWFLQPKMMNKMKRFALVSFSDRMLAKLTRPSLKDFVEIHPEYDLMLEEEALLDSRDFHPAWNKLAYARRAMILGSYEAVVCLDDDILITEPFVDPIGKAINEHFGPPGKLVIASLDEQINTRVPFNTGVLILKSSPKTLMLLDEVFKFGRRLVKLVNGHSWVPRVTGLWDQDAFADYINFNGKENFALLPHGQLQTFVRSGQALPQAVFAMHFTGLSDLEPQRRIEFLRRVILTLQAQTFKKNNGTQQRESFISILTLLQNIWKEQDWYLETIPDTLHLLRKQHLHYSPSS